jgi:probable HAF family extracellular repeat protein
MWFDTLLKPVISVPSRRRPLRRRPPLARLCVEGLEDRALPTTYLYTDLGTLGGGYSRSEDVNALGQVVGTSATVGRPDHAVLWTGGALIDLGTLGGARSTASAINDHGQVAGSADTPDGIRHAFLLSPEDTNGDGTPDRWFRDSDGNGANDLMTALEPPPGLTASIALDINNAGEVVGGAADSLGRSHALLWTHAVPKDLGTLGGQNSRAVGINDAGQVVGASQDAAARNRAFLWDPTRGMTDLGTPAGYGDVTANKISPSGLVAGQASDPVTGAAIGFLWTPAQPNAVTGTMTTLAPASGVLLPYAIPDSSTASDVNDAGVVIGSSTYYVPPDPDSPYYPNGGYYSSRASVWRNGIGQDLGVAVANAINAAGQIAGADWDPDYTYSHAILLTPTADPPPALTIENVNIFEGQLGTVSAVFTVSLSAAHDQAVTVDFSTADGTATAGSDYQAISGTVTFAPGETRKTITVSINGDRLAEPDETFVVNLSGATNAIIVDSQGTGTIFDDEPHVRISDVSKTEGKKNQTTLFTFTVTLSAAYDQPVTVSYRTVDGTARTSDGDYVAKTGTLIFAAGETTKTITIEVKGDGKREANETLYVDLYGSSATAALDKSRGIGTILNDD